MKKVLSILSIIALSVFVTCSKDNDGSGDNNDQKVQSGVKITIDGDFTDWVGIDASSGVAIAKNHPESLFEGVKEIRCYASEEYVYYYIKFDSETLEDQMEKQDALHTRLCINTDGEFASGYNSYFLDAYDYIIEGSLAAGGEWATFDGTLYQRTFVEAKGKVDWLQLLAPGKGLVTGAGGRNEYEISVKRDLFNSSVSASPDPNQPFGDTFHTGIRFYCNGWSEMSNMPNASGEDGKGWGHLLEVNTQK